MKDKLTISLVVLIQAAALFMLAAGGREVGMFDNGYQMYGFWFTVLWSLFGSVCFGIAVFAATALGSGCPPLQVGDFKSGAGLDAELSKLNKDCESEGECGPRKVEPLETAIYAGAIMLTFLGLAMKYIVCHVQSPDLQGEFGGWVLPLTVSLLPVLIFAACGVCAMFQEGLSCLALVGFLALFFLCLWGYEYRLGHWVVPYLKPDAWQDIAYEGGAKGEGYDIKALPKEALSVSEGKDGLVVKAAENNSGDFEFGKPSIKVSAKQKCTIYDCTDVLLEDGVDATCLSCGTVRALAGARVKASGCRVIIAMPGSEVWADGCRMIIRMPGATVHQDYSGNEVNIKVITPFVPK